MSLGHGPQSPAAAVAVALVAGACSSSLPENSLARGGAAGTSAHEGAQAGIAGHPVSGGVGGGGGSAGGAGGAGGTTGAAGKSGSSGSLGSGGTAGSGGTGAFGGAVGSAGTSGRIGAAGADQAGRGGDGAGGAAAGSGGSSGIAAMAGRGGDSGAAGGGAAGSGGSGNPMRSSGCDKAATLSSGSRTIQSSGQSRSYILRIPANYDSSHPYRLIFGYHWVGGTMQDVDGGGSSGAAWSYYGLREQANDSTIFVAPQGISNGWGNSGGQDVQFTDDLIKLIEGDLCVDTTQLFALGFSYGGSMTYALACARPAVFRAVAVYSGGVLSGCDGGTQPVPYLGIHGLSDGTLNISGGRSMRDKFVMNNGCTAQNAPEPSNGSGKHVCTSYQGCRAGYPVEWCAFDGGHTPGNVDGGGDDGAKTWTKGEVWKFFTQFQ